MAQTFKLKKGEILFEKDKIIISDKAKTQRNMTLSSSVIWMCLGIVNLYEFEQSSGEFFHSFWAVLTILNFLIFIVTLSRSTKSLILLDEVKSIKVKQRFRNKMLDIKLKNNQLRRVIQVEETEELQKYIDINFKEK
jgi:hypothetical protein